MQLDLPHHQWWDSLQRLKKWKVVCWAQWLKPVIPATLEVDIRRIVVWSQPGQKIIETLSQINELGIVAYTCYPSYVGTHRGITAWGQPSKNVRPYLKSIQTPVLQNNINKNKKTQRKVVGFKPKGQSYFKDFLCYFGAVSPAYKDSLCSPTSTH
jgi:hypothetical protein